MIIIDEASRFRVAKALMRGLKQSPSAAACLQCLQEGWCEYFGTPRVLRLDPAGAFRSQAVEAYCDRHSIHVDLIPGEAHHQIGESEQAVKGVKEVMKKLCEHNPDLSVRDQPQHVQLQGSDPRVLPNATHHGTKSRFDW